MIVRLPRFDPYGFLIFLVGLMALLNVFLRHVPERLEALFYLFPEGTAKRALFIIGLLLVYLSEQISRRKRNAWYLAVVLLSALVFFSFAHRFEPIQVSSYLLVLILFILQRKQFVVQNDLTSFRRGLMIALAQLVGAVLLIGLIFIFIDQREFGRQLTTTQILHITKDALLGDPLPTYLRPTRYDRFLIDLLRLTAITGAALFLFSLFRPLRLRTGASHATRARAEKILHSYGSDPEDFFKIFPEDKQFFSTVTVLLPTR